MQYVYIMAAFRNLMSSFKVSLDDKFSSELTSRLIAFILFIIALVMVYVALWVPFIIKIKNDVKNYIYWKINFIDLENKIYAEHDTSQCHWKNKKYQNVS